MKLLREIPCWHSIRKIKFSPDGKRIFVNSRRGANPDRGPSVWAPSPVFDIDYLDDGLTTFVKISYDKETEYQLVIADTHTQKNIKSVNLPGQSLGMCADHR